MRKTSTLLLSLVAATLLSGCHLGMPEEQPDPELLKAWAEVDPGLTKVLSAKDFDKLVRTVDASRLILHKQKPTIIEVYRPDCSHCLLLKPYLAQLSKELGKEVPIYTISSCGGEGSKEIIERLQVTSVPTLFLIYKDGSYVTLQPTSKWEGDQILPGLRSEVEKMLKSYVK